MPSRKCDCAVYGTLWTSSWISLMKWIVTCIIVMAIYKQTVHLQLRSTSIRNPRHIFHLFKKSDRRLTEEEHVLSKASIQVYQSGGSIGIQLTGAGSSKSRLTLTAKEVLLVIEKKHFNLEIFNGHHLPTMSFGDLVRVWMKEVGRVRAQPVM